MEGFEYHAFHWCQAFLNALVRRQHDDLRKHTAGILPSCAQLVQEVRRVVCASDAEIQENQHGGVSRRHGPVYPGEGGLPAGTRHRAIPRKLKHPAEQFLDCRLVFSDQDMRRSGGNICLW